MKNNFRKVIVFGAVICGLVVQLECKAQSTTSSPGAPANEATAPVSAAAATVNRDAVMKELAEMKARIAQLEAELKASNDVAGAEKDANALRTAVGTSVSGGSSSLVTPNVQAAAAPAPAATPAPPEIRAEVTTKEAPFPGDWTWLNSNGRVVDTPMAT